MQKNGAEMLKNLLKTEVNGKRLLDITKTEKFLNFTVFEKPDTLGHLI